MPLNSGDTFYFFSLVKKHAQTEGRALAACAHFSFGFFPRGGACARAFCLFFFSFANPYLKPLSKQPKPKLLVAARSVRRKATAPPKNQVKLVTEDILAPTSMKNAAKCDT